MAAYALSLVKCFGFGLDVRFGLNFFDRLLNYGMKLLRKIANTNLEFG